ncbi:Cyclic di-GMP phosphodiesterase Gmr [Sulfitobacter sp. THAF37]|uniref:putative bifunctional diguanylate cyclase/phosphodiesterase n=1 Tax=Sulfitobacter sp. THAF37 TaxID=2587855 RepID=UPI001268EADD|nr:bifunctional diguanylate cyclase/phosphodiesterase [Sulfitobacter sp. THAF37]QFT57739.1 Cyclic di-GMP phosphodiesterase Gmr [Sulfitobacter sp. THAF37]
MAHKPPGTLETWQSQLTAVLDGPGWLLILPALTLGIYATAGETGLIGLCLALPVLYLGVGRRLRAADAADARTGLILDRPAFAEAVEGCLNRARLENRQAAVYVIALDSFDALSDQHGQDAADKVVRRTGERLLAVLRDSDIVAQLGDTRFGICTAPVQHLDLETCIQLAARLQTAIEEPVAVDGINVYVSASIGFCQRARAPGSGAEDWMRAAFNALREAQSRGPSAIRAFSDQMRIAIETRDEIRDEVVQAVESGQIQPWFQPQISTDTGAVTGFEALARWHHPRRGVLLPQEFLPAVESAGLLDRLTEVMMYHTFAALKAWDSADLNVPQVGVNFTSAELRNPRLTDKVKWELDRFDLAPERLAVEILETVVAGVTDDLITRNVNALSAMGCRIDLDDFGTGHAAITSIRRLSVSRIKIDRSFVMKSDRDPEQQRMISAILTMAERLEVETLAEGVETVGEHVLLAQLGCDHVQGYGIGRPMPFDQTLDWIKRHAAKLENTPRIMDGKRR